MSRSDVIDIEVILVRETDAAIRVRRDETVACVWLPKSQIEFEGRWGTAGVVTLPEWLATEKGLI